MKSINFKILTALMFTALLAAVIGVQPAYAAGIVVDSAEDTQANDGECTLREAIINANNNNQSGSEDCAAGSGADLITFADDYTIVLTAPLPELASDITIDGTGRTITIDGDGSHRVFYVWTGTTVTLDNLTIINGYATDPFYGGAIKNNGVLTVKNSAFTNNHFTYYIFGNPTTAGGGGAIGNSDNSTLTVENSTFTNNSTAGNGGAISGLGTINILNSTFRGNSAGAHGGAVAEPDSNPTAGIITIENSTFYENTSNFTGGAVSGYTANLIIKNSTFSDNESVVGGGISITNGELTLTNSTVTLNNSEDFAGGVHSYNSALEVKNSILWGNTSTDEITADLNVTTIDNPAPAITYSIIKGGYTGDGNIDADPLLGKLQANGGPTMTHALLANSPAIDMGTDIDCPTEDQRGFTRPFDGDGDSTATCDIGAVETKQIPVLSITNPFVDFTGAPQAANVETPVDGTLSDIQYDGNITEPTAIGAYAVTADFNPTDTATYEILNDAPAGNFSIGPCYVDDSATGDNDGSSWANAYTDLQSTLGASSCKEIWVAAGTYSPDVSDRSISFVLKNGVEIYGGFAGTETQRSQRKPAANPTILSGEIGSVVAEADNSYHVVDASGTDNTAVLDGFIIQNGFASNQDSNREDVDNGGGIFINNGSPILRNLHIRNNVAEVGGGISAFGGGAIVENVTFSNNFAFDGGGMSLLNSANFTLTNVTFFGNNASYRGGAMHIQTSSNPTLTNVTIAGNNADSIGGGISNDDNSDPILSNVIVWGNTAPLGAQILNADVSSEPSVTFSIVQGGYAGFGNLSNNPMLGTLAANGGFAPTLALRTGSRAIDSGDPDNCPLTDQRGVSRPLDGDGDGNQRCDIGAYESQVVFARSNGAQDGWILESGETTNKGGMLNKGASTLNLGDDAANRQYRAVLSFNTSDVPTDAFISAVTLRFRQQGIIGGGNPVTAFKGFMVDIRKGNFGTATLQLADFSTKPSKGYGAFKPKASSGWYTINLTNAKNYINRSGNTQIRLRFKVDDNNNGIANFLKIHSGNANLANRPQLIVDYYMP